MDERTITERFSEAMDQHRAAMLAAGKDAAAWVWVHRSPIASKLETQMFPPVDYGNFSEPTLYSQTKHVRTAWVLKGADGRVLARATVEPEPIQGGGSFSAPRPALTPGGPSLGVAELMQEVRTTVEQLRGSAPVAAQQSPVDQIKSMADMMKAVRELDPTNKAAGSSTAETAVAVIGAVGPLLDSMVSKLASVLGRRRGPHVMTRGQRQNHSREVRRALEAKPVVKQTENAEATNNDKPKAETVDAKSGEMSAMFSMLYDAANEGGDNSQSYAVIVYDWMCRREMQAMAASAGEGSLAAWMRSSGVELSESAASWLGEVEWHVKDFANRDGEEGDGDGDDADNSEVESGAGSGSDANPAA